MTPQSSSIRRMFATPTTKETRKRTRLQFQSLEERAVPATYTVTTDADSGAGSLRQALVTANGDAAADTIVFDAAFFSTDKIITLASQLPVTNPVTILNTAGASQVTIEGINTFGIFSNSSSLTLDGVTVTKGGNANAGGVATLANTTASLTVKNSVLTGNAGSQAGVLYVPSGSTALQTFENSTISNNTGGTGAIYYYSGGALLVRNSTLSGNVGTSTSAWEGGAIIFYGGVAAGGFLIENSTIHGNTSASTTGGGGGINFRNASGTATIRNSTITGNTAPAGASGGGGIGMSTGAPTVNLISTIVAENTGPAASPDILITNGTMTGTKSFIGVLPTTNFTNSGSIGGVGTPQSPVLGGLANNGGSTLTRLPLPGSPVINAGSNPGGLVNDQRGTGFVRALGGLTDIGAIEGIPPGNPVAEGNNPDVETAGATTYQLTITYKDLIGPNIGLNDLTINGNNNAIRVTGPGGYNQLATFVSRTIVSGTETSAVYSIPAAGGTWGPEDFGTYTISVEANQVFDLNGEALLATAVDDFQVAIETTLTVLNDLDTGTGSLRDIITLANTDPNPNKIVFDPGFFNTQKTISLLTGLPGFAAGGLEVEGPGAALLTVQRDAGAATNFRIFASGTADLEMSGMTVSGGTLDAAGLAAFSGGLLKDMVFSGHTAEVIGAIFVNAGTTLTIQDSTITGNAAEIGAAIYVAPGATLNLVNSTVSNNTSTYYYYGARGGAIFAASSSTINIVNSTISGNTTDGSGGAIYTYGYATVNITDSTISGNTATVRGGGVFVGAGSVVNLTRTTIADNFANGGSGGGVFLGGNGTLNMVDSTLSGNTTSNNGGGAYFFQSGNLLVSGSTINNNTSSYAYAGYGGGGIYFFGTAGSAIIRNSTIANNTAVTSGGGVLLKGFTGTLEVENSTIVGNQSQGAAVGDGGGGIGILSGTGLLNIENSVVSGNTSASEGPDIRGAGASSFSAIGDITNFTDSNGGATNLAPGTDLMLNALASNGGPTQTMIPQIGSPLIDAGDASLTTLTTDQIGGSHARVFGADVDIGSFEMQPPKVSVEQAATQVDPTNGASIVFDIVFNMAVADFVIGDITLTSAVGGSVTSLTGSGTTYQATVTGMTGEGVVQLSVAAGVATDVTTLTNEASTSVDNEVTFDNVAPTPTIALGALQNDPTNIAPVKFLVTFSEDVTGFDASDVDLSSSTVGGALIPIVTQVTPSQYEVEVFGMTGAGDVVLNIAAGAASDVIGNTSVTPTIVDNTITFDAIAPTVTVNQASTQADPSGGSSTSGVKFDVVFSEPITGLTAGDFVLTGTTAPGATVTNISGSGSTYVVTVGGMTASGLVKLSLPANTVTDLAGNDNLASSSTDNEVTFTLSGTVQFSAATYTISEQGSPQLTVTVTRTGGSEGPLSVDYASSADTATDGDDYDDVGGTLTWLAGDTADKTFNIQINDDNIVEIDETFNLSLSNVSLAGALGTLNTAVATITDYEEGQITFDAASYTVNEGGTATIKVQRVNGSDGAVSVDYDLALVTAEAADHGTPSIPAGTLTWADGDATEIVITIPIIDDTSNEGAETLEVELSNLLGGATLGTDFSIVTIAPSDGVKVNAASKLKGIFTDADGDTITVGLGGVKKGVPSEAEVFLSDGAGPISLIKLTGTDPLKASLGVKVKKGATGDGRTGLGEVTGTGLKGITATKSDLEGAGINLGGYLGSVKIGNILNGADIIATGTNTQKTSLAVAGTISDGTLIQLGSILNGLKSLSIGDAAIVTPSAGKIAVNGNFGADITLSGLGVDHAKGKKTLGGLSVKGVITGATISVVGNIGSVASNGFVDSRLFGSYTGPDTGTGTFNTITSTIGTFSTKANPKLGFTGVFDNSFIVATALGKATFAGVDEANPTEFGVYVRDSYKTISIVDTKKKFTAGDQTEGNFNIKNV